MARLVKSTCAMWVLGLILMAQVLSQDVNGAVTCSQALSKLMPCMPFLKDSGGITATCCQGVQLLNNLANTKPDRQAVCECLKIAWKSFNIDGARAKQIPRLCNIKLSVPVDPSANCANA